MKKIAFVGPLVTSLLQNKGFWDVSIPTVDSNFIVSQWEGLQNKVGPGTSLLYAKGCEIEGDNKSGFSEAIAVANQADVVILSIGEKRDMSGEAKSRSNINIPGVQEELLQALLATGKPVVVLINAGRPLVFNYTAKNATAILYTWWLGSEAGNAIADVLFGDYNPSAKLPMTFPMSVGQIPIYYNHFNTGRPATDDNNHIYNSSYLDESIFPKFPFGFGLSYTSFSYANLALSKKAMNMKDSIAVSFTLTNTGKIAGAEVVQLYLHNKRASVVMPVKALKDFQKIMLQPGESKKIQFNINKEKLSFYNANLKWESTIQSDLGVDYSFLNYAITLTADYYIKRTKDLLVNVDLPLSTGFSSGIQNLGEVENSGYELSVRTRNIANSNFTWMSNFNLSANKNKVINIGGEDKVIYGGDIPEKGYTTIVKQGGSIGNFYGYVSEGVDPQTGNLVFKDLNGDGLIDDFDRTVIGNATPDFIIGLSNTFSYKNFDFDFLFQACNGNEVFNATRIETEGMFSVKNGSAETIDRWQTPGDITAIPIAVFGDPAKNSRISSRFIEDGSYLRLRSLALTYHMPKKIIKGFRLQKFDIYLSGQNVFVLSNYSGYDPEVNRDGNSISQGIDYGTYPQNRTIIGGVKIEF